MNRMNICDLCGSESFVEFTVKSKHLRWVLSEDLQKLDTRKNNWLTKDICEDCFKKIFGKQEDHTIKQEKTACERCIDSDREIDCSKCDVQKELEQHYRPFKDTAELILHYERHFNVDYPPFYEPMIWVKSKATKDIYLIDGYDYEDNEVGICDDWFTLKGMFERYTFLDDSIIGKVKG